MNKISTIFFGLVLGYSASGQYTVEVLHEGRLPHTACFGAGGGQQVGSVGNYWHWAILWKPGSERVSLHDQTWRSSWAFGTDGQRQVGYRHATGWANATMWSGTAENWVNLHPESYDVSIAYGISGDVQVGYAKPSAGAHADYAVLWRNTAESMVVLHPPGMERSMAHATDGTQHVGFVVTPLPQERATLWEGTSRTFVDLNPRGYQQSIAYGVARGQQVGGAAFRGNGHAALWYGTANSFVDLNPGPNAKWGSRAYATNGYVQVGLAAGAPRYTHAAAWRGSPESYINLHRFLPPDYHGYQVGAHSEARGIDEDGNISGFARHLPTDTLHAVVWRPILD